MVRPLFSTLKSVDRFVQFGICFLLYYALSAEGFNIEGLAGKNTSENKGKHLFLLGGRDLEMVEIGRLLDKHAIPYLDAGLTWKNAVLSAYKAALDSSAQSYETIYGLELRPDIPAPANYRLIDHHNELPPRPSALEQVAEIIGVKLKGQRYRLVIANDVAHIAGMRACCAPDDAINQIRLEDRRAQGVTPEDEEQAARDLISLRMESGVGIVQTELEHFSPIADRIQLPGLLIYNATSLTYYGKGAREVLEKHFEKTYGLEERGKLFYSGGSGDGFLGLTEKAVHIKPMDAWAQELTAMVAGTETEVYSTHAFMLPLKWDFIGKTHKSIADLESIEFDDRTKLGEFDKVITACGWTREPYRIKSAADFNELTYFHDYVQKVIFDMRHPDEGDKDYPLGRNRILAHYNFDRAPGGLYSIYAGDVPSGAYHLQVRSIGVHVFNTGVLILTYNLENRQYPGQADVLKINEYGRRIYPQFLADGDGSLTAGVKKVFLANRIELRLEGREPMVEDFARYNQLENLQTPSGDHRDFRCNQVIHPPAHLAGLLLRCDGESNFVYSTDAALNRGGIVRLSRLTDDRMFFQCWYGNDALAKCLGRPNKTEELQVVPGFAYVESPWWYAFVFGDKAGPSIANTVKMRYDLKQCSLDRWVNYGTVYGFTRDSMVAISQSDVTLKKHGAPDLKIHMQTMYYQLAVICLAQRASVLRFSGEVTNLTDLARNNEEDSVKRIKSLYLNYIEFINKIYFREVTSQIQGIEIYKKMQEQMEIARDVRDLDTEIEELHRFANLLVQEKEAKEAKQLTLLATLLLPATLIAGFLGMNINDWQWSGNLTANPYGPFWMAIFVAGGFTLIFILLAVYISELTAKIKSVLPSVIKWFRSKIRRT